MTHLSIIGRGTMAQATAKVVRDGGNTVELLGREDAATVPAGNIGVVA